jgi:heat shock protein HtpX
MRRRFSTRDRELSARIVLTLVLVSGLYLVIVLAVVLLVWLHPRSAPFVAVIGGAVVSVAALQVRHAGRTVLERAGATRVEAGSLADVEAALGRLAALADVRVPGLWYLDIDAANAFTVALHHRRAAVVVTRGLLDALTEEELEAVLAHELSHIANRDASVMTYAITPRILGQTLVRTDTIVFVVWFFLWPLGLPLWGAGEVLTLALSRYRELTADRGSALLTGRPASLMSALQRLQGAPIPTADLRGDAVEALCVVPTRRARFALLQDHPPLEKRLARLAEMARVIGSAVGP